MIHTVIFDIGGTLIGGPNLFGMIIDKINMIHNVDITFEFINEFQKEYHSEFKEVKTILNEITERILIKKGKKLKIDVGKLYVEICINDAKLFEDTKEILEFLKKKGIKMIVVSDADEDALLPEMDKVGITKYFDKIIISSRIKCYKTSKEIVKYILPHIEKPYEGILFVGDSEPDIETANRLGIRSVHIDRKQKPLNADYVFDSLSKLKQIIQ